MDKNNYLISNMKFFQTNRTLTAICWNSLQPELWKFLDERFHCFSLHPEKRTSANKLIFKKTHKTLAHKSKSRYYMFIFLSFPSKNSFLPELGSSRVLGGMQQFLGPCLSSLGQQLQMPNLAP